MELSKNYDVEYRTKLEQQILGVIINASENSGVREIVEKHRVIVDDFRLQVHKYIFEAILECYRNDAIPTVMTVTHFRPEFYRFNNAATFDWEVVKVLQKSVASSSTLDHDIMILKQFVLMEFWNEKSYDILYGNWNGRDVLWVGDIIVKEYDEMINRMISGLRKQDKDTYAEELTLKVLNRSQGKKVGVAVTVDCIDEFMSGYNPGELYILAGRPGMAKTTFALISSWETSKLGNPVVFFSLEMPKNQLKSKIISLETGIDYKKIKSGDLTTDELQAVLKCDLMIENSTFYIEDQIKTIEEISSKTREYVQTKGVKLVVIDYIQRVKSITKEQIRELITIISRECKSIAKDNYIAVLALSQLSRAVESRPNKRPLLSDLKESGSIEEDADVAIFLFRQSYYDINNNKQVPYSELWHTEFSIAKGRDIGTKTIHIFIDPIEMTITEYSFTNQYNGGYSGNKLPPPPILLSVPDDGDIPF